MKALEFLGGKLELDLNPYLSLLVGVFVQREDYTNWT